MSVTDEHEKPHFSQKTREMGHPRLVRAPHVEVAAQDDSPPDIL
jgi:hypothetical protein